MESVTYHPIGKVKIDQDRYFIELDEEVFPATLGLDQYSHIQVVWWCNLYDSEESRKCRIAARPYINGPDQVGLLATRSPVRPNPIGITACPLINLEPENHRLQLAYIDCEDGTPILDIKPYEPSIDRVRDVVMPAWSRHWPGCFEESGAFDWSREFNFPD